MKCPSFKFIATILALATCLVQSASIAAESASADKWHFDYAVRGDARARPVQVFDDGKTTYFQFARDTDAPAIFSATDGRLLTPQPQGVYYVLNLIDKGYKFRLGEFNAYATSAAMPASAISSEHVNATTGEPSRVTRVMPAPQPKERHSYATPIRGDTVTWDAPAPHISEYEVTFERGKAEATPLVRRQVASMQVIAPFASRIVVIGREDDSYREGIAEERAQTIRSLLVRGGTNPDVVRLQASNAAGHEKDGWISHVRFETVASASPADVANGMAMVRKNISTLTLTKDITGDEAKILLAKAEQGGAELYRPGYQIRVEDQTVRNAFERWGQESGYRFIWEAEDVDAPITATTTLSGDIAEAVRQVMTTLDRAGYPVMARLYADKVFVVLKRANS